ncbi:response regulator [Candidatus Parcubacteria bacterium]|nr:response regulator [Patescibacteria group bacterium]MBU4309612.1 response regulator [Patescibacteria group bacterium]MBU4432154.1 response regulator [Patescibacteria group bacterium]MBU4578000.1 response regulator [Patescibacteria group bacterium]MCG2696492.1 response regulator [Candidatus Parcubacteria bacterium]
METTDNKKKIVLVEDDEVLMDMYCAKLEMENFIVYIARNGKEGYDVVLDERPDIIITDLVMPKKDGFYLIEKVKGNSKVNNIPLIVLTNLDSERDKQMVYMQGVNAYLVKSRITPEILTQEINKLLEASVS